MQSKVAAFFIIAVSAALASSCNSLTSSQAAISPTDEFVSVERSFASRAGVVGWGPAFREYAAPDAQMAQHGLKPAADVLTQIGEAGNDASLFWWPVIAGASSAGDLGFTTGPFIANADPKPIGQYFTVWKRQPDGSLKWIYDGGPGPLSTYSETAPSDPTIESLGPINSDPRTIKAVYNEIKQIENTLRTGADLPSQFSVNVLVLRRGHPRKSTSLEQASLIARSPSPDTSFHLERIEVAKTHDLAISFGNSRWLADDEEKIAAFVHVWRFESGQWKLLVDLIA